MVRRPLSCLLCRKAIFRNSFAERIGGVRYGKDTAIYKFEKIKRAKRAAMQAHPDTELFDLGVGEPDAMADAGIVETLSAEAAKPENRGYSDNGDSVLKNAAARYLRDVCGVTVDAETQVVHSIGSKAALSILPAAFINPGDVVLMTVPGYPVSAPTPSITAARSTTCRSAPRKTSCPTSAPSRRTSSRGPRCSSSTIPTIRPAPAPRPSFSPTSSPLRKRTVSSSSTILPTPRSSLRASRSASSPRPARSTSARAPFHEQNFNMTGWRCGFVAGNELLVKAYADIKDNTDSGQFLAIQHASAYAFDHPEITGRIAAKYSRRMDLLVETLRGAGFQVAKPRGSFFLYVAAPKKAVGPDGTACDFANAESFSQWMITENLISTVPWDDAGAYVRFSVTFAAKDPQDEKRVVAEIARRLGRFVFHW